MIIDGHEHVMLPTESQLKKLDEANIDRAILFTTTPHVEKASSSTLADINNEMQTLYTLLSGNDSPQERLERMKSTIIELKEAISYAPERLYGFGPVPLGLSDTETEQWIHTYIINNSFYGVGEFTPGSEKQIAQLEPVFRALTHFSGLPIWIHTFNPVSLNGLRILMNLCRTYPTVPVIFGHMGGSNWMEVIAFAKQRKNVYLDLSAAFTTLSVKTALVEVPEQCLFGSDAPFGEPYLVRQFIEYVSPSLSVTRLALGENMANLLHLS